MLICKHESDGFTILQGPRDDDWVIAPFWPCSGKTLRKVIRSKASKDFAEEACAFADQQFFSSDGDVPSEEQESAELE